MQRIRHAPPVSGYHIGRIPPIRTARVDEREFGQRTCTRLTLVNLIGG